MWIGEIRYFSSTPLAISTPVAIWFANCGGAIGFAILIFVFAFEKGAISKSLTAKPLVYLGEISFSL